MLGSEQPGLDRSLHLFYQQGTNFEKDIYISHMSKITDGIVLPTHKEVLQGI